MPAVMKSRVSNLSRESSGGEMVKAVPENIDFTQVRRKETFWNIGNKLMHSKKGENYPKENLGDRGLGDDKIGDDLLSLISVTYVHLYDGPPWPLPQVFLIIGTF